ncbi:MAG: short-chain dehydrogenase [Ignavibacteria bacterium]|nr:short-chain dehydrogenase [Ignavibacteria bacterium]
MEIFGKKVLVLGGWGLVGSAVCRELMKHNPAKIFVSSLRKSEAEEAVKQLQEEFPNVPPTTFEAKWGNIFARTEWKDMDWHDVLANQTWRHQVIDDIYNELTEDILQNSALYSLLTECSPDVVIDCVNTATAIAYQDIYKGVNTVREEIANGTLKPDVVEKLISSIYIPQLIRHIQILYKGLIDANVKMYVKIGTSGTGGMGLNIPYTHSEERPSRVLLAKSAVAGAQTLLLYLMARTPNSPLIKEIKPAAAIAWKKIAFGDVIRKGRPIKIVDMPLENAKLAQGKFKFNDTEGIIETEEVFKSVFIDTGENGIFSRGEFEAISALGQMEIVTPEEIAIYTVHEILGGNTGKDVIQGLDAFTLGPTYRGGFLQSYAVEKLKYLENENNTESIAFELLGPPRLSKLLYEANILKHISGSLKDILNYSSEELSQKALEIIKKNYKLRSQMLSIGLVILLPDGKTYLRGKEVKIPVQGNLSEIELTDENIEKWCKEGWVDLRSVNFELWKNRIREIINQIESQTKDDTSSRYNYTLQYWDNFESISEGKIVGWIFENEDKGWRFKR